MPIYCQLEGGEKIEYIQDENMGGGMKEWCRLWKRYLTVDLCVRMSECRYAWYSSLIVTIIIIESCAGWVCVVECKEKLLQNAWVGWPNTRSCLEEVKLALLNRGPPQRWCKWWYGCKKTRWIAKGG